MLRKIPLQKREEGLRYCSRYSLSEHEDSEASVKDRSLGSNGEDLSNESPEKKAKETGPTGSRQGSGNELMEYIRVEKESQIIKQGDGESGGSEPPTDIDGSEKDAPCWRTPERKGPAGQQPPMISK